MNTDRAKQAGSWDVYGGPKNDKRLSAAYIEGRAAMAAGRSLHDVPYGMNTLAGSDWRKGWRKGWLEANRDGIHSPKRILGWELVLWFLGGAATGLLFATYL